MAEQFELASRQHGRNLNSMDTEDRETPQSSVVHSMDGVEHFHINRSVLRKLDFILLPFLCLFFLVNSLDRSNIGNAETANFTGDVGLDPSALNTAVAVFFAFFVAFQPIGAAFGRWVGMVRWVPSVMTLWGLLTILHIFVRAEWQLILLRIVIGCLEAGFYPVTVAYLSLFYTRFEFARRLGFFYGQFAIAGALGGIISFIIFSAFPSRDDDDSDRPGTMQSWQILFIVEGALTMIIAISGFAFLPHGPGSAWFLTGDERVWAEERIKRDRSASHSVAAAKPVASDNADQDGPERPNSPDDEAARLLDNGDPASHARSAAASDDLTQDSGLTFQDIFSASTDWKVWYLLVMNILSAIPATAFGVFLPLVVQGITSGSNPDQGPGSHHHAARANLYTAPPFIVGALFLFAFTHWSDRRRERFVPILCGIVLMLIGLTLTIMLPSGSVAARYLSLHVLLAGSFIASPLTVAWLANNIPSPGKRSIVLGINGWGNLAGVFSALIFAPRFAPDYVTPFWICLGLVLVAFAGFLGFRWILIWENAWRRRVLDGWEQGEREKEEQWGLGSLQHEHFNSFGVKQRLADWFRRRFNVELLEGRHGDEKMTFQYGL